jgi:repressor LexA
MGVYIYTMPSPTPRQLEILEVVSRRIAAGHGSPSLEELATHFDIHVNAIRKHLISLAEKGLIELLPGRARGIRLPARRPRSVAFELPLVGRVAAGAPILSEGHIEARYQLDPALFRPRPDFLLRVEGHSMIGVGIEDGDLIAVHRTPVADPGRIVVARLEGEITVKRLARDGEGWQLLSANPDFAPIRVPSDSSDFAIEGLYVGAIKRA